MRLLAPTEIKNLKKADEESALKRRDELGKEIRKRVDLLNTLPKNDPSAEKKKKDFAEWEMQSMRTKAQVQAEIEALETRRRIAMAPLTAIERALEAREATLNSREMTLSAREKTLSEREIQTENTRKAVEASVSQTEAITNQLLQKNEALQAEEARIAEEAKSLELTKQTFHEYALTEKQAIDTEKTKLEIEAKRLSIIEESLIAESENLAKEKLALKDQRDTLQRAWEELRNKQNNG